MLLTEWNWDTTRSVWREEGLEEGLAKGRKEGRRERAAELLAMLDAGYGLEELRARLVMKKGAGLRA